MSDMYDSDEFMNFSDVSGEKEYYRNKKVVCRHGQLKRVCELCEKDKRIAELEREVAELRKDAERYRFLREQPETSRFVFLDKCNGPKNGDRMDKAIDAAIGKETKDGQH